MRWLRQTIRGCGDLPHVGSHPGTLVLCLTFLGGAAAGAGRGGLRGAAGGMLFMCAFIAPLYLKGAYDRAVLSDRLTEIRRRDAVTGEAA